MYKIGEFSFISKTTIKTLRYYEEEKLLKPCFVDSNTGYRFYETSQINEISKIVLLREVGLSIKDIKKVLDGEDIKTILMSRKNDIESELLLYNNQLQKINIMLKESTMKEEIVIKDIPSYIVYYKDGKVKDFSEITNFILSSAEECLSANPNIKCVESDYCYLNYLDGEYKEKNIKIRYAQAVTKEGKETDSIKFMKINPVKAICVYHKGSYENLRESYNNLMKYIEDNNYEIEDFPRECYIYGCWNKDNVEDYLTEIQVPVKRK